MRHATHGRTRLAARPHSRWVSASGGTSAVPQWRCAGACAARQGGAVSLGRCRRSLFHVWPFIRRSAASPAGPTRSASSTASSPACKRVNARARRVLRTLRPCGQRLLTDRPRHAPSIAVHRCRCLRSIPRRSAATRGPWCGRDQQAWRRTLRLLEYLAARDFGECCSLPSHLPRIHRLGWASVVPRCTAPHGWRRRWPSSRTRTTTACRCSSRWHVLNCLPRALIARSLFVSTLRCARRERCAPQCHSVPTWL